MAKIISTYTQCKLKKNNIFHVSWIPTKFAQVDRLVDLKIGDKWDKGWKVTEVYSSQVEDQTMANRDAYKYHRDNTDI